MCREINRFDQVGAVDAINMIDESISYRAGWTRRERRIKQTRRSRIIGGRNGAVSRRTKRNSS